MADQKLFAGPRIRRARQELGVTQAAMARELGISPSYLNLIERNQRPLTAQVLLKLATHYRLDLGDLGREGGDEIAGLKEAFADPLLSGEITGTRELVDLADTVPNAAAGVVKLYRAYREALDRLSELSGMLAERGVSAPASPTAQLPVERFRAIVETCPHHHAELDEAAEAIGGKLSRRGDRRSALADRLEGEHGMVLRMLPAKDMPLWRLRNDRHTRRLFLSEALSPAEQTVLLAGELMRLEARDALASLGDELGRGESDEVRRLLRAHVLSYAAHALAMPYRRFHEEAMRMRYDVGALAAHFDVGFDHAVRRLVSLQRINASAPPFFSMLVDGAGHVLERLGARGFPAGRFGGGCAKLPLHDMTTRPGETRARSDAMPDGTRFVLVAHGLAAQPHGYGRPMPRRAVLLGMDAADAEATVYASSAAGRQPIEIGLACRLCERQGCPVRAEPAVTRPAGMDEWTVGATRFDFQ